MSRFAPFLSKIQEKLEEAKISDLNHELGKLAQESANYLGNIKAKSYFRSGSGKFWSSSKQKDSPSGGIPKSISLPSGFRSAKLRPTNNNVTREDSNSKYKYRSSAVFDDFQLEDSLESSPRGVVGVENANVVDRFIRVIESKDQGFNQSDEGRHVTTREDIRKKLADFSDNPVKKGSFKKPTDLEVCFINDFFDEDQTREEGEVIDTNLNSERFDLQRPGQDFSLTNRFPRSKSDWEAFKSPQLVVAKGNSPLSELQAEAALALTNCTKLAKRKIESEKQKRDIEAAQTLKNLIGRDIGVRLTRESLENLNLAALQVIVNNFLNRIEKLNEDLVELLIEKDDLQIEQDGQLVDIDDLSQPSTVENLIF